ncbi:MAG: ketoacyl-ACP synthase III [Candidatus Omnitrophica bacterium]|nr:ketoacyl-ACP synthase III [Candidatus Omnitrophota bacterium]
MTFSRIVSTGMSVPENIVTNEDIAKRVETSDEWIFTRTGIHERRVSTEGEATSTFATNASRQALEAAGMDPMDLQCLIVATITPDLPFPASACLTQEALGAKRAAAFDISAACSGYVYALSIADAYIRGGLYENVMVVGAETLTKVINWEDRGSCILFGDGAGATLVTKSDRPGVGYTELGADGGLAELIHVPGGGSKIPTTHETVDQGLQYAVVKGRDVYKVAVSRAEEVLTRALEVNNLKTEDIALLVPHQANQRITDAVQDRLGFSKEQVASNIEVYGNTSAASVPICLHEAASQGRIKEGDKVLLVAFGAGFTWGTMLIDW